MMMRRGHGGVVYLYVFINLSDGRGKDTGLARLTCADEARTVGVCVRWIRLLTSFFGFFKEFLNFFKKEEQKSLLFYGLCLQPLRLPGR